MVQSGHSRAGGDLGQAVERQQVREVKNNRQDEVQDPITVKKNALQISRLNTKSGIDPLSTKAGILWEKRNASISDANGVPIFEQKDVEVPATWSQMATNIVVNKYFRGAPNTPERETSVRQLVERVAKTIASWGGKGKYFKRKADQTAFLDELSHLLITQKAAFNSPVWFNVGVENHPQCSACFINSVDDSMSSILDLAKTEGMLFKGGSGAGTNFSTIRSSKEMLRGGGSASGPVSFMKGFDSFAGVIKSGGKTRRAAKMVILNIHHPDIEEFIDSKRKEEEKAWALIEQGYDGGFNVPGGAYDSIQFQNGNHSVRVDDEFMRAVESNGDYQTKAIRDGEVVESIPARQLWRNIAEAAWLCGDPGLQFDTLINEYHTCPKTDRIHASNPCSEYMFLNDSACNLASINLIKYRMDDGSFDVDGFKHAVGIILLAQEIVVDFSSYPTDKIAKNSHKYRPLGLGYANLGALLMSEGLPYDSEQGRAFAASLTALMGGEAYRVSSQIAQAKGAFEGYQANRMPYLKVMKKHRQHVYEIDPNTLGSKQRNVLEEAKKAWDEVEKSGSAHGFKNSQVTVLAPTGTIGFMMDCDTTGIEPDIALIKYKTLVGGGMMKIVNQTVPLALDVLGYDQTTKAGILAYLEVEETIEGAPGLKDAHLPVFDCAFKSQKGSRSIAPMGHVKMMAAAQPFLSGAISKTVNMPTDSTVEDIEDIHMQSWKLGVKAVAIYRDGCKRSQPLSTSSGGTDEVMGPMLPVEDYKPASVEELIDLAKGFGDPSAVSKAIGQEFGMVVRRRLPAERQALTHKFSIGGHEGYVTVGLFEDGRPGELFCTMAKSGSTISGLMDAFATSISMALQYGVPLDVLVNKFSHTRFEPSGFTGNKEVPMAKSVTDYIFRWLAIRFVEVPVVPYSKRPVGSALSAGPSSPIETRDKNLPISTFANQSDSPPCQGCGTIMVRSGSCYKCYNCGSTSGCS